VISSGPRGYREELTPGEGHVLYMADVVFHEDGQQRAAERGDF